MIAFHPDHQVEKKTLKSAQRNNTPNKESPKEIIQDKASIKDKSSIMTDIESTLKIEN